MFRKSYKLKSNAALKGSEVKRLRQRVEKEYPKAKLELLLPPKSNIAQIKIITHHEFQTHIYCVDKLPMFFETESGHLAPTLYALWLDPHLLPYFSTWQGVLPKLSNGADLMLPGVVAQGTGMNMYGHFKKDQLVAINLTSNKSAVGVGFLFRSSDDLYMCGGQGIAVKMLHLFGDKLWSHDPALVQQVPIIKPTALTNDDFPALGAEPKKQKAQSKVINDPVEAAHDIGDESGILNEVQTETNLDISAALDIAQLNILNTDDAPLSQTVDETTEPTPEQILKSAFLAALKNHGKTLQLPLLTSNFYRLYVVPEFSQPFDLKKTCYKKLSGFLNAMIDEGFIVVREETKGVDKITSIDLEHPEIVNFITDFKSNSTSTNIDGIEQPLFHSELTELYIVTDTTAAFFTKLNYKRGEGIQVGQIKKIIREYVNKQNLPIANTAFKTVKLDETLRELCNCEEATLTSICNMITEKMEHSFQMCSNKDNNANKPLIQMSLATRSGNKKVTLVSNVDCYGIILSEFIKLCKQGAAASTTIIKLPNQKREQLQIQGNQIRFVYNLLTDTYKVPPKCILGLELAKDGKKHKKK